MKRFVSAVCLIALALSALPLLALAQSPDPFAVVASVDRLGQRDLWPGFDASAFPIALFDGHRTLLFRHPAPPEGFRPLADPPGVFVYDGRHPAMTANTSALIGEIATATVLLDADEDRADARSADELARLVIHELFHVYQRKNHPSWVANEVDLFVYPVEDADLLARRRMETAALRAAFDEADDATRRCWTDLALAHRGERFARMDSAAMGYERGTEWNEGLATYVAWRAKDWDDDSDDAPPRFPATGFAPEDVRERAYVTGFALARLLDRHAPAWRDTLAAHDDRPLDALLADALADTPALPCRLAPLDDIAAHAHAEADLFALRTRRAARLADFEAQPGWSVEVVLPHGDPLWPSGFDPLNVVRVRPGGVLHTRFVELSSGRGKVEVLGHAALTEAAGAHPLFEGVRRVLITGLAEEPRTTYDGDRLTLTAPGLSVSFFGAQPVLRERQRLRVTLIP